MGRRRVRIKRYDAFLEEERIERVKDDRDKAAKVKSKQDLDKLLESRHAVVASEIRDRKLVEQRASGDFVVNDQRVKGEAENLKREVMNARFYPEAETDKQYTEQAKQFNVSPDEARRLQEREYQVRARAVLASAKAGDTKLEPYTVGILNKLAAGDYQEAVYGKADSSGGRKFSRGRFFTELGFDRQEQRRKEGKGFVGTAAAKDELRRNFLDVRVSGSGGRKSSAPTKPRDESNRFAFFQQDRAAEKREDRFSFERSAERRKEPEAIVVPF